MPSLSRGEDPTPHGCRCPWNIPADVPPADAHDFLVAMAEHGAVELDPDSPLVGVTKTHEAGCPFGGPR